MKHKHRDVSKLDTKKAIVLNQSNNTAGRSKPIFVTVAVLLFLGISAVAYSIWPGSGATGSRNEPDKARVQLVEDNQIVHPVHLFDDGKARFFEFQAHGGTIRYFVIKSADGIVRAAFDACDVCWRAGKGYAQDGDFMVCGNCGRRFASNLVNEVQGGCNPAPLERSVQGDTLIIKKDDIIKGKIYFNTKKDA